MNTITIGFDIAKSAFHLIWVNESGGIKEKKLNTEEKAFQSQIYPM